MANTRMSDRFDTLNASLEEVKDLLRKVSDKVSAMEKEAIASSTSLVARHESNFERIATNNKRVDDLDGRVRALEVLFEKSRNLESSDKLMSDRIDETEKAIAYINKVLPSLIFSNRLMTGLAGVLGVSVVGLIWSLITGQVNLTFP